MENKINNLCSSESYKNAEKIYTKLKNIDLFKNLHRGDNVHDISIESKQLLQHFNTIVQRYMCEFTQFPSLFKTDTLIDINDLVRGDDKTCYSNGLRLKILINPNNDIIDDMDIVNRPNEKYIEIINELVKTSYDGNFVSILKKYFLNEKLRFINIELSIISEYIGGYPARSNHANTLLIDLYKRTIEHFESYGSVPIVDVIDENMIGILKTIGLNVIDKNDPDNGGLRYYSVKDVYKNSELLNNEYGPGLLGPQKINEEFLMKNTGEPILESESQLNIIGYCVAWCLLYVRLRANFPDITSPANSDINKHSFILILSMYGIDLENYYNKNPVIDQNVHNLVRNFALSVIYSLFQNEDVKEIIREGNDKELYDPPINIIDDMDIQDDFPYKFLERPLVKLDNKLLSYSEWRAQQEIENDPENIKKELLEMDTDIRMRSFNLIQYRIIEDQKRKNKLRLIKNNEALKYIGYDKKKEGVYNVDPTIAAKLMKRKIRSRRKNPKLRIKRKTTATKRR